MYITLEPHGIYQIVHAYACQHSLTTGIGMRTDPFLIDVAAEQLSSLLWSVRENPLVSYRIFGSKFAYLFILVLSIHPDMQNGGEGLLSIILASNGLLEKMRLITLELHGIF